MQIDQGTVDNAVKFLTEGSELEAANFLRACTLEYCDIVDHWQDGSRTLSGILLELVCSRAVYEVLSDEADARTKSIRNAFRATFPTDCYLKSFRVRAVPGTYLNKEQPSTKLTETKTQELITAVEIQKGLMISSQPEDRG